MHGKRLIQAKTKPTFNGFCTSGRWMVPPTSGLIPLYLDNKPIRMEEK